MSDEKKRVVQAESTPDGSIRNLHINSTQVGSNLRTDLNTNPSRYDWIPLVFLNLILQTAFIPNTKITSTLLLAHAGLGKTIKLEFLRQFNFIKYTLDITPKNLKRFLDDVDRNKYKFLVIPDYIATLGHSKKTVELARSIFRAMIEEGITDVDIFGMEASYDKKIKAGLISGITPEYFAENTRVWKSDGFLQRFLPFSYSHSNQTRLKVLDNIRDKVDSIGSYKMNIKLDVEQEPLRTEAIDNKIRLVAFGLIEPKEPPYRMYQQLVSLCNASAVLRDSNEVQDQDIELITLLSNYINRGENPL